MRQCCADYNTVRGADYNTVRDLCKCCIAPKSVQKSRRQRKIAKLTKMTKKCSLQMGQS